MKVPTLAIEGSTYSASVALLRGCELVAERKTPAAAHGGDGGGDGGRGGDFLAPLIQSCLAESGLKARQVKRVVCGAGPGSFTSLRIAASIAKGIAVAAGAELYAASSLLLTVAGLPDGVRAGAYLSVLPAMRGECFAQLFVVDDKQGILPAGAMQIIAASEVSAFARLAGARIAGLGQELPAGPEARGVARVLPQLLSTGPVDISSWEPDYGRLAEAQVRWEAAHGRPLQE